MSELIHVHIGTIDGNFPVRRLITTGSFAGCYEIQQGPDTVAWVHQRWCSKVGDTDWRKFLHDHWLQDKNMLNPDFAEEFLHVFMAAQQAWKAKQRVPSVEASTPAPSCAPSFRAEKKHKLYPDEVIKTKKNTWIQLSLF